MGGLGVALDGVERARRLELLFAVIYPRGGTATATSVLVAVVNRRAGSTVLSGDIVDRIRGARGPVSTVEQDSRITDFFGVPAGYMTGAFTGARVEAQLGILAGIRAWDEQRLESLLGELAAMITGRMIEGGGNAASPPVRRPVCLRLVRPWRPEEDKLNTGPGHDQRLWRSCQARVRELQRSVGLPEMNALEEFLDRLAAHRGRPIELRPFTHDEVPDGICGLWINRTDRDVIGFPTEARHATHIVMHEVAHMLCGHRGGPAVDATQLASFMPDLDPDMVRSVLGRSVFSGREEREAELIGSLIMDRVTGDARPLAEPPAALDPVNQRLHRTFGG